MCCLFYFCCFWFRSWGDILSFIPWRWWKSLTVGPPLKMCISIVSSRLKTFAISQIAYLLMPIIIVVEPCANNTNIRQNTSIPPCCDGYIIIRVVHTNVKPSFTGACNHPPTRNDLSCKQSKYISYPQYSTSENLTTKYANIANSPLLALDTASKTSSTSQVA